MWTNKLRHLQGWRMKVNGLGELVLLNSGLPCLVMPLGIQIQWRVRVVSVGCFRIIRVQSLLWVGSLFGGSFVRLPLVAESDNVTVV